MIELEFWEQLRTSINSIDAASPAGYCDWIEPKRYLLGSSEACITGKIGFVAPQTREYRFRVALPEQMDSLSEIDWAALLPQKSSQAWLTIEHDMVTINTVDCET